jgi:hypothetical protein
MAAGNNLRLDEARDWLSKIKDSCARIYRPGMSIKGPVQYIFDYVGDKNVFIGATILSLIVTIWSFTLFAILFAILFSIAATTLIFVGAKLIFYKPKEYSIELDGENTILSFVKDVHVNGESEIVIHSQPGYGKEKNTFVMLQLFDSISILDCRNITSVSDKTYRDITIRFFHPVEGEYNISAFSNDGSVAFEVIEQTADQCRVKFMSPVRKKVRLNFIPS